MGRPRVWLGRPPAGGAGPARDPVGTGGLRLPSGCSKPAVVTKIGASPEVDVANALGAEKQLRSRREAGLAAASGGGLFAPGLLAALELRSVLRRKPRFSRAAQQPRYNRAHCGRGRVRVGGCR
jgi:hypothetical protein